MKVSKGLQLAFKKKLDGKIRKANFENSPLLKGSLLGEASVAWDFLYFDASFKN